MTSMEEMRNELEKRLSERVKVKRDGWGISIAGPDADGFMEDSVNVFDADDHRLIGDEADEWVSALNEAMGGRYGVLSCDLWGKSIILMNSDLYTFVKQVLNTFAEDFNLLKVYSWGCDDGGLVIFEEGKAVKRSYWGRGGVEYDDFGPLTEEDFWAYLTSTEYDDDLKGE